ncbi:kelch-like protein 10 [Anopheles ziemanni]|uniref:kelch-like protein 10 n=1 Tax=Anopheles coustani TaxID=139045 RepID=UPI00265ABCFB|nr:kelch-like protein 10 [Anopheles coustani]XP_058173071.1 kelch-like protein 10 [Anopheles ziemanni]
MMDELHPSVVDQSSRSSPTASASTSTESLGPKRCISYVTMQVLNAMRLSETLCDASIVLPETGREYRIHRVIIGSCSDYFHILFTTTVPSEKYFLELPGIPGSIMEEIIRYAYLRECALTEDTVFDVYAASDFLLINSLTERCTDFILSRLRLDNCVTVMLFGRQHASPKVQKAAWQFMLKHFTALVESDMSELLRLEVDDLGALLADDLLNVREEDVVWEFLLRWINHDPGKRARYIGRLMKTVRFGLMTTEYFLEKVKDNQYVQASEDTKQLVIDALTFLYDLEMISTKAMKEMKTPAMATPRLPHEVIFTVGGWGEGQSQSIIETYDTRADRWIRVPHEDSAGPRAYYGAAHIGRYLYFIGGYDGVEHFNSCRRFDMIEKGWKEIAPMHCRRCYVSVVTLDGFIYAMGGYNGANRHNSVERYDPRTNQWTIIAPMGSQRSDADACTLDGMIYITGGFNGHECLNTAEMYDPRTDSWSPLPPMLHRRSGVSCAALCGSVYVVGGFNGLIRLNSCERYEPAARRWIACKEMYHQRSNFGLEVIDDMLFAIGGYDGVSAIAFVECYGPEANEWLEATDLSMMRSAFRAVTVGDLPNIHDYVHSNKENLINEMNQYRHFLRSAEGSIVPTSSTSESDNEVD